MNNKGFHFEITESSLEDQSNPLTTANLVVSISGTTIWPVKSAPQIASEIQIDDLLSYLTEFWKPLMLRQTYPLGLCPERPSLLRVEAERRWSSHPAAVAEREDELISAFEDAHDLSRCFAGQFGLPPLWLLREGDHILVEIRECFRRVPFEAARNALADVGDRIATRLEASASARWSDLIGAWRDRDRGDAAVILAWSASLDRDIAENFMRDGVLSAPVSVSDAANDDNEARLAARMAGTLPPEQIRQVVTRVNRFQKTSAPKLDRLGAVTADHIATHFGEHRPYEQGEAAAKFVRRHLDLMMVVQVDIFDIVDDFGPILYQENVAPATLFALAVWGHQHGPAILINRSSLRLGDRDIRRDAAARVTLAHEFCHLLLDRGHALSAVEILGGRMPLDIERRAKAFAGEFLLPAHAAADAWSEANSPRSLKELDTLLRLISRRYGVTRSVAAWKLDHGLHRRDVDLSVLLDAVVPNR